MREQAKLPKNFRPKLIKLVDVNTLYSELRVHMCELPLSSKVFGSFDLTRLNEACQHLNVNAYILDCELTANGDAGTPGCLRWRSQHIAGGIRVNMFWFEQHLMFINNIKLLFKQFQCGSCRRCFKLSTHLDKYIKSYNGGVVTHRWCGGGI